MMTDDDNQTQKLLLRRLIRRQLISRGKPSDDATVEAVFEQCTKDNPGPWFDLVTDPEMIKLLNEKAGLNGKDKEKSH